MDCGSKWQQVPMRRCTSAANRTASPDNVVACGKSPTGTDKRQFDMVLLWHIAVKQCVEAVYVRSKTQYVCQQCGAASPKWIGRCPSCQQWNTFVEERSGPAVSSPPTWDSVPLAFDAITGIEMPRV